MAGHVVTLAYVLALICDICQFGLGCFQGLFVGLKRFPTVVDPEPIRGVAANGLLEGVIDVPHDGLTGAWGAVFERGNFRSAFDAPTAGADAVTDAGVQR